MIEIAKEVYDLNPDDGIEYQWINFDNLEELNFIEINAIMACIEHCILLKHETNEIVILRDELSRRFNNKNRLSKATIEPITIITVLLLVFMVYIVFTKIQVTYLYGEI